MPHWAVFYLLGSIGVSAWAHLDALRQRATLPKAALELLGDVCLALPSLAYWDRGVGTLFGQVPLGVLLALGSLSLLVFTCAGMRATLGDLRFPRRRRWLVAMLGSGLPALAAVPELWWGLAAMHLVPG